MTRGGSRPNAGRKSNWHHSDTTVIRVPKQLIPQIMEYVTQLDRSANLDWHRAQFHHAQKMILRLSGKPQYASVIAELHQRQSIALAILHPHDGEDF
jgi:hypothetical protein